MHCVKRPAGLNTPCYGE